MRGYLIDSSIFVAVLRGKDDARKLLTSIEGEIVTSSICLAELYEGIFRSKKQVEDEKNLLELLSTLGGILSFDSQDAKAFGKLSVRLAQKPIPDMDLQIAATCLEHRLTLVTYDIQHFDGIESLSLHKLPEKN